jgi:hypothetical protein
MKTTLVIALLGFLLAVIDFTGASRWVEAKIRKAMRALLSTGVEEIVSNARAAVWVIGGLLVVGLLLWTGRRLGLDFIPEAFQEPPKAKDFVMLPLALFGGGMAMIVLYGILWVLSLPKRGVVSTVGLLMGAVGVVLELVS